MLDAAIAWLQTTEAKRAARHALQRRGLPASLADDVLQDAGVRLVQWRAMHDRTEIDNVEGFAHRVLQRAAQDLHRRERRRPVQPVEMLPEVATEGERDTHLAGVVEDEYRRVASVSLALAPWTAAAVLNELTFHLHAVPVPAGVPSPGSGDADASARWAALWLAGMRNCFPSDGQTESSAMRKRRSRALDAVRTELRRVVEVVEASAHG